MNAAMMMGRGSEIGEDDIEYNPDKEKQSKSSIW